jgi:UDP-N-acetylmuramyl tripeptide synthase
MGRVAARLADWTVLTSDNPRSEDPMAIIAAIEQGFAKDAPVTLVFVADYARMGRASRRLRTKRRKKQEAEREERRQQFLY